jgi:hypothetical protein
MAEVNPQLNPQPLPPGLAVRVSAPASVLNDLETFQKAQAGVLKQAGCPGCHSGLHIFWQAFTDFTVNQAGEVRPVALDALPEG